MRLTTCVLGMLLTAAVALVDAPARAQFAEWSRYDPDDPYQVPDAPAPPTLPDLTHRGYALSLELTGARVEPLRTPEGQPSSVGVLITRLEAEAAVSNRRWYVGIAEEMATGRTLSGERSAMLVGNPEVWGRGLWASSAGLAYGGGLGIVPPAVPQHAEEGPSVRNTVRVVRPWDYPLFAGRTITFRPFLDVRSIDGPVMLQLRQGLDVLRGTSSESAITGTWLTSRTAFYIGYRPVEQMGIGLELWEVYFIKAEGVSDDQRATFAVSPSLRWMWQVVQPSLSGTFPVDRPLFHSARSYWAVRLGLSFIVDPSP